MQGTDSNNHTQELTYISVKNVRFVIKEDLKLSSLSQAHSAHEQKGQLDNNYELIIS